MSVQPRAFGFLALLAGLTLPSSAGAQEVAPLFPFVLPWDDAAPGAADLASWNDRPAGASGFVAARDGHLWAGPKRLRILGVNLCFGANFPSKEDAPRVAARMAKFGINAVRFHHMDMQRAPGGIFAADGQTLDPGQLDRLDFLIAQLRERGIYADLNLHVSRSYPGLPTAEGMPSFLKGVDNFDPAAIDWQKRYARDLLHHINPYTGHRYADEPAVALVEINNENALIHEWWNSGLDQLPDRYAAELDRRWNAWLGKKYADFAALKTAWGAEEVPLGGELLSNADLARGLEGWTLEQHAEAKAEETVEPTGPHGRSLRIRVERPGREGWHVQLTHAGLAFREGQPYTLRFRARADAPRRIAVNASQAHEPWQALWNGGADLTTVWVPYQFVFAPGDGDDRARISISNLGAMPGTVELADLTLRPGGVLGLRPRDAWGKVQYFRHDDFGSRTVAAQRDWIAFLWEVEQEYWTGMERFLKQELGVKMPVVGTQMGWSPFPIQAKLDAIDSHSYWQHPAFPGRGWDPANWTVQNLPMAGVPDGGTLPRLALSRVAGRPFLCTEYNHSAPNTYSAETLPLIAAFAAMQDWDGVFLFAYSHRTNEWDRRMIPSFFDIDQHPTKMATFPAAAALFRRGDVAAPAGIKVGRAAEEQVREAVRKFGPGVGADRFGVERDQALRVPVGVALADTTVADESPRPSEQFLWGGPGGRKVVKVDAPRSKALIGEVGTDAWPLGDVVITPGPTRQNWAAFTLTALDGADFHSPGRVLLTATGYAENTDMGWKDAAKTTVGADWGRAPSLVEGIPATVTLPVAAAKVRGWALDERGQRRDPVEVRDADGKAAVVIGPQARTLWYELEIVP